MNKLLTLLVILILFIFLIVPVGPLQAVEGGSLYLSPARGTYFVDSTFDVSIFVNTGNKEVNAVQVDLEFPPDKLQVVSPTTGSSFISVWVAQPTYSNTKGTISFQGGAPSPGINTSSGLVSTVTFRAKTSGTAKISFSDSCRVLLNDAQGTNILTSVNEGIYTIVIPPPEGPIIYSSTHPDQNKWYKNNSPAFNWEKEEGVTDFSYSIDNDPQGVPDNISEGNHTSTAYTDLTDGIWYFHIKAKRAGSWGGISHFPVKIDATPPADFSIKFESAQTSTEPIISFVTTDVLSGVDHYEFKLIVISNDRKTEEVSFFTEVVSPHKIPGQKPGAYGVIVRAYDKAGNWQDAIAEIVIMGPAERVKWFERIIEAGKSIYVFIIIFVGLLGFLAFYYRTKKKQRKLRKEFAEVKKSLGTSFGALKDDIKEELKELEKAGIGRGLTKEEKTRRKELLDNLKVAEEFIEKEVKDVEEELK